MTESDDGAHHRALAAFVAEHRDRLEAYADSDKQTAELAEALLEWDRADRRGGEEDGA